MMPLALAGALRPAEAGELAAELQVLAVSLLERGVQGLRLVTVLFLEVADLAGQGLDDRVVAVGVAGRDLICPELSGQRICGNSRCGLLFQILVVDLLRGPVLKSGVPTF